MSELEQLTLLCERLGAPRAQAATMAAQLLKRAEQLAAERGTTREAALARLLDIVVRGRSGEVPSEFSGKPSTPTATSSPEAKLSPEPPPFGPSPPVN